MERVMVSSKRSIELQRAADLVADLADAVEALGEQLDRLHAEIGDDLYWQVQRALPLEVEFGPKANAGLVALMRQLTPPDDYDPADARMM